MAYEIVKISETESVKAKKEHIDFCRLVANGMSNRAAYLKVYSTKNSKSAARNAYAILARDDAKKLLSYFRKKSEKILNVKNERILAEYAAIAFSNISEIFNDDNSIKNISDMPEHVTRSIKSIKVKSIDNDDVVEITLHDKQKALDKIAEINGLTDKKLHKNKFKVTINK